MCQKRQQPDLRAKISEGHHVTKNNVLCDYIDTLNTHIPKGYQYNNKLH